MEHFSAVTKDYIFEKQFTYKITLLTFLCCKISLYVSSLYLNVLHNLNYVIFKFKKKMESLQEFRNVWPSCLRIKRCFVLVRIMRKLLANTLVRLLSFV